MIITVSEHGSKSSKVVINAAANPASTLRPTESSSPLPSQVPLLNPVSIVMFRPRQSTSALWRFLKAFFTAGVIYIILGILVQSIVVMAKKASIIEGIDVGPVPSDGRIVDCFNPKEYKALEDSVVDSAEQVPMVQQANYPNSVDLSFSIPSNSSVINLFSRGSYDSGEVTYQLSDKPSSGDKIEIDINISYNSDSILARSQVCVLDRDGGRSIGFFTPKWIYGTPHWLQRIRFTTIVRFPRLKSGSQSLVINSLKSSLNNWPQHMASLESQTLFNNVSLQSSNAPISIDAISVISGSFKTSNAPITGSFNVSKGLELHTSNAPVDVQVSLENDPTAEATILDISTSNAQINAPVSLISTDAKTDDPASFFVSTRTSNGRLIVTFPEAPSTRLSPFYVLNFIGRTSNMPISATLHPTYEGSLFLSSSLFSPRLTSGSSSDPSGGGRSRTVAISRIIGKTLQANAWWGEAYTAQKGKVELSTSNAFNEVILL